MNMRANLIPRFNVDYSFSDLVQGIRSLHSTEAAVDSLVSVFDKKKFYFMNRGRSALYVILKSLNLPKGSKIGVPLYSCTVVFDAIIAAGFSPCFIDIGLETYTLDPLDLENKIDALAAVVVIHTFGRPADMDAIKKVAKNIPIIEDCAHSMLSEYKGRVTGTIGDAAFFSLEKYISAGGGGMIIVNRDKDTEVFDAAIRSLPCPSSFEEIKHIFSTYLFSLLYHAPWYGLLALPLGTYVEKKVDLTGKTGFKVAKQIRRSDLGVFLNKFNGFRAIVELQRKNSQMLLDEIKDTSLILPSEQDNTWWNHYLLPLRFESRNQRDRAHKKLMKLGVDSAKLFSKTPEKARLSYGYLGDCEKTEELSDTILTVPNYYTLSEDQILNVAKSIKLVVGAI